MMLQITNAIGPGSWVAGGDVVARREAIQDLFFDHPLRPEHTEEDWPDDRQICSEMVLLDGQRLVGTGMLVVDPEREDFQVRVFGVGLLPEFRSDFIVHTLEESLIKDSELEDHFPFIEGADGRIITNPAMDIEGVPVRARQLTA